MNNKAKASYLFTISKEEIPLISTMDGDIAAYEDNHKNFIINEDGEKEYWCERTPIVTIENEDYLGIRYSYNKDGQILFIGYKINGNKNKNRVTYIMKKENDE